MLQGAGHSTTPARFIRANSEFETNNTANACVPSCENGIDDRSSATLGGDNTLSRYAMNSRGTSWVTAT
jgi:hypothetical protein